MPGPVSGFGDGIALTPPSGNTLQSSTGLPGRLPGTIQDTPQTINVIVRNLEKMGAIRKSADAEHGRILRLTATAKGQALLKRCRARVKEVDDRLAALVGRDEEKVVRRWLSAATAALS